MDDAEKKQSIWRRWGREVSSATVAGVLVLAIVALVKPVRVWLFAEVNLLGWGLVVALLAAAIIGGFIAWFTGLNRREPPVRGTRPARPALVAKPFEAGGLEERVLQTLRFADGRWAEFALIRDKLAVSSSQDLQQVISRLSRQGWIEEQDDNYVMKEGARRYRLGDKGITYAKQRGFQTETELRRIQSGEA